VVAVPDVPKLLGCQEPRILCAPARIVESKAAEVLEVAATCGITPYPWQRLLVEHTFGFVEDGLFAAPKVGVNVPRQNGKGEFLLMRQLGGIFVLGEKVITHTSQMQDTSLEAMKRLIEAVEEGGLTGMLKGKPRYTNGQEAIHFQTGRVRFRTRSKTSARGWSGQCVIFDEAMFISEAAHNAAFPIMSAQSPFQVIYTGSAVDQQIMEQAEVWARVREEGIAATDPQLLYAEWSAPYENPDQVPDELDLGMVAKANPTFGLRITESYIRMEHRTLSHRGLAVERYGAGDYPRTDGVKQKVIPVEAWTELADPVSEIVDGLVFAFDVSTDRKTWVAMAGKRADGLWHVEIGQGRGGTAWFPRWLAERVAKHDPLEVVCDGFGPAMSILPAIDAEDVEVREFTTAQFAAACGQLEDAVKEKTFRHRGQDDLLQAVRGAKARPLLDKWAWGRRDSSADVSPLIAATLALSAAMEQQVTEMRIY
jgi:hypothetical protein